MNLTPEFQSLIAQGSTHGLSLAERKLFEQHLAAECSLAERGAFRDMTCFIPAENILPAANVSGFARTLGRGLQGYQPSVVSETLPAPNTSQVNRPGLLRLAAKMKLRSLRESGEPDAVVSKFWEEFKSALDDDTQPARPAARFVGATARPPSQQPDYDESEFSSPEVAAAYRKAVSLGMVSINDEAISPVTTARRPAGNHDYTSPRQPASPDAADRAYEAQWNASEQLQAEFSTPEVYAAYSKAVVCGLTTPSPRRPSPVYTRADFLPA